MSRTPNATANGSANHGDNPKISAETIINPELKTTMAAAVPTRTMARAVSYRANRAESFAMPTDRTIVSPQNKNRNTSGLLIPRTTGTTDATARTPMMAVNTAENVMKTETINPRVDQE